MTGQMLKPFLMDLDEDMKLSSNDIVVCAYSPSPRETAPVRHHGPAEPLILRGDNA